MSVPKTATEFLLQEAKDELVEAAKLWAERIDKQESAEVVENAATLVLDKVRVVRWLQDKAMPAGGEVPGR